MKVHSAGLRITGLSVCALFLSASILSADSIVITGGALVVTRGEGAHLDGRASDGFRLIGAGDFTGGIFAPYNQCFVQSECGPGQDISLFASWSGSDFTGSVTVDGTTYPLGFHSEENFGGAVQFMGSATAPSFDGRVLREISAPFSFAGSLLPPATPDPRPPIGLTGAGTATLRLNWISAPFDQGWQFDRAVYEFNPIPEPGSIVLLGIGLSGLVGRRLHRRHA